MLVSAGMIIKDRYRVLTELGRGGFSVVWRAEQVHTGQLVAIKILRSDRSDDEAQRRRANSRFDKEIRLLAKMSHPNIVKLIDADRLEDGQFYTVMDYLEGQNLSVLLDREGRLTPARARDLMVQCLDALAAAHKAGVIHRDFKPHNVVITQSGLRMSPMVVDFGIATLTETARGTSLFTTLTAFNEAPGTLSYMPPEQIRGEPATPAGDLYSWGLVFLECLFGKVVVTGRTPFDVMSKHTCAEPIPSPDVLARHPLGAILARAIHKDPARRYGSASALMADLDRCALDDLDLTHTQLPDFEPANPTVQATGTIRQPAADEGEPSDNSAPRQAPEPVAASPQRRQVVYLCAGLVFLGEAEELGDAADDLLTALSSRMARTLEQHGAEIIQRAPDQVLAAFGLTQSQEDDAQRAVTAAHRLLLTAQQLPGDLTTAGHYAARVALHSELVVAGAATKSALPRVALLAQHLQRAADPDTVLVSDETSVLLRSRFELGEPRAAHTPWGTRRVRQVQRADAMLRSTQSPASHRVEFVGRAPLLEVLSQAWRRALSAQTQRHLVVAEPGFGKSRLVSEFANQIASDDPRSLTLRCLATAQNSALWPVVELLRGALESTADPLLSLRSRLKALDMDTPRNVQLLTRLIRLPGWESVEDINLPSPEIKRLTLNILSELLQAMAVARPTLLVVEDLHWADPTTLEWLKHLVDGVSDARLVVLMTTRPGFKPPWTPTQVPPLELTPLSADEAAQLLTNLAGGSPLPERVRQQIVSRTDRVPLYLEEVTRLWMHLNEEQRRRAYAADISADRVLPGTIRLSIAARLDQLGEAKATAMVASVVGRDVSIELLRAISPLDASALSEHLNALVIGGILSTHRSSPDRLSFRHSLVQETAYEALVPDERGAIHLRVAQALVEYAPHTAADRPGLVAYHFAEAGAWQSAAEYSLSAATQDMRRFANKEAYQHVTNGLGWLDNLAEPGHANLQFDLATVQAQAAQHTFGYASTQLEHAHERCRQLAPQLTRRQDIFPNLWGIWVLTYGTGKLARSLEIARENLSFAEQQGDEGHLLEAHLSLSGSLFYMGELAGAFEHMSRTNALYKTELHHSHALSYGQDPAVASQAQLGWNHYFLGRPDTALTLGAGAITLAKELNHPFSEVLARGCFCVLQHFLGDPDRALVEAAVTIKSADAAHFAYWRTLATCVQLWASGVTGQDTAAALEAAIADFQRTGAAMLSPLMSAMLAEVHLAAGRPAQALATAEQGLHAIEALSERFYEPEVRRLHALALAQQGAAPEQVITALSQTLALADQQGSRSLQLRISVSLAEQFIADGQPGAAACCLERALSHFTEGFELKDLKRAEALLISLG